MVREKWLPEFDKRREFWLGSENTHAIQENPFNLDDGDIIRSFMRNGEVLGTCTPGANLLGRLYGRMFLEDLNSTEMDKEKNALLYDCASDGDGYRPRKNPGPLTARQLFDLLSKDRFHVCRSDSSMKMDPVDTPSSVTMARDPDASSNIETKEPDAERRRIYIADLDRWYVLALMATASIHQAGPLQRALYWHHASEGYIGLNVGRGLPVFELAFHLPFQAFRPQNAGPLPPGARDVSFLDWDSDDSSVMCRAIYSCTVAGPDKWRWVAYCFVDTYFDGENDGRESAEDHFNDTEGPMGISSLDPCGYGFTNEDIGPDPRCWFLKVLDYRLAMINAEFTEVVSRIESSTTCYREKHYPSSDASEAELKRTENWMHEIQRLIPDVSSTLSKTLRACEGFLHGDIKEFSPEVSETQRISLGMIKQHTGSLLRLQGKLCELKETCATYNTDLTFLMDRHQRDLARDNRAVSLILMICTPVLLTSGIFSMEDEVRKRTFPSIAASSASFFKVLSIFTAVITLAAMQQNLVRLPKQWRWNNLRDGPCHVLNGLLIRWLRMILQHALQQSLTRMALRGVCAMIACVIQMYKGFLSWFRFRSNPALQDDAQDAQLEPTQRIERGLGSSSYRTHGPIGV